MKAGKTSNTVWVGAWVALMLLLVPVNPISGAELEKVAIIPFSMNSQQDLSFLQKGIVDMLSTRIIQADRVEVLNPDTVAAVLAKAKNSFSAGGALDETKARIIGANLKADYVLYGSFTLIGDSSSLDASMVTVTGVRPTLTFSRQGTGLGSVIPQINEFASEINAGVFGRSHDVPPSLAAVPETSRVREAQPVQEKRVPGSAFVSLKKEQGTRSFVKLADLKGTLNCLAAGDVDGDGTIDLVAASDTEVSILKASGEGLVVATTVSVGRSRQIVGIDVGDINMNGKAEIFVSCLNIQRNVVVSTVYEQTGSGYSELAQNESLYFRVISGPGGKPRLVGQKPGLSPYTGDIVAVEWKNGTYISGAVLDLPRGAGVMGLAAGDVLGTNSDTLVYLDQFGKLTLVGTRGKTEWKSSDRYGGSMLYFLLPRKDPDGTVEDRSYFQTRLMVEDMDGDGKPEVVSVKNHEVAGELLSQFRQFTKGNLEVLSWDGLGLSPVYRTALVSGYIGDFCLADLDSDGNNELIVTVVTKGKGLLWSTPQSSIIRYTLN